MPNEIWCPVCQEVAFSTEKRGPSKGFKGAAYTEVYYQHGSKECVRQSCYYPNYFGKGPKTIVHTWSTQKTPTISAVPTAKEHIQFTTNFEGKTQLTKSVPKDVFMRLLKADAVSAPKPGFKGWNFDRVKAKPILEESYIVD
jgi:hypothetical protein